MPTKATTMRDIAKAAGVSQSTVSMILNRKTESFPRETVDRVLAAAAALNYSFRRSAKPQPGSDCIMVMTVHLTNPYYCAMQQGIERAADEQGLRVMTTCSFHDPAREEAYLKQAISQGLFGVIFLYPPDNEEAFHQARGQIPIVTVCDKANNVPGDIVEINNFHAGALAARHLLDLGHTGIAVLSHSTDRLNTSRATRVSGILSEIRQTLSDDHLLVLSASSARSAYLGYLSDDSFHYHTGFSLAQNKKIYTSGITGIICVNDLVAYGVMDALTEKGYRIPEDFSIIGSDNLPFSSISRVSLTTIELHTDIISRSALSTLINRAKIDYSALSSSAARFQVQCQPMLMLRGTTGPAPTGGTRA